MTNSTVAGASLPTLATAGRHHTVTEIITAAFDSLGQHLLARFLNREAA
jgi:hypothetical protein